jgi:hypothetical protein
MQTSPVIGNLSTVLSAIGTAGLILWRFNAWIKKHLRSIVTEQVKNGVTMSLAPLAQEVAGHTKQVEMIRQRLNRHERQIIQLSWAGAETVASAAIWSKKVPSPREVDLQSQDWRRIVSDEDLDHKE